MECNKDEAIRAKGIAEKKLMEKDIAGAKKLASKSQNLFPGLEGLSQFLDVIDVYISAEKRVIGEVDWYAVLGVYPLADDETIRKQYRRLALALHPDKNKSVGADGAFKILSEAWSLLSDKAKRLDYDKKRNVRAVHQKVTCGKPPVPADKNGFRVSMGNNKSSARNQKSSTNPQPTPAPPRPSKPKTFWTSCNQCLVQYEYLKIFLNQKLLCPNCRKPFLTVELPAPLVNAHNISSPWHSCCQQPNVNQHVANNSSALGRKSTLAPNMKTQWSAGVGSINGVNIQQGPCSQSGGVRSDPASAAQAPHVVQPACVDLKRGHEEAAREETLQMKTNTCEKTSSFLAYNAGSGSGSEKGERPMKNRRIDEHALNNSEKETVNPTVMGNGAGGQGTVSGY
ncbi:unnamed protein product [Ilex paraguariensis]|uniref:J domain-containing protein n=1 Tax=Ilex paraguariensis TaxID=185542 RepID=A0ABC8UQ23_9AQUA